MALSLVTPPTGEPVSLEEAKAQGLIGDGITDQDSHLDTVLIPAARDRAELATGRALITQAWDLVLDGFPCEGYLEIPKPPLVSVTHLKYRDTAGVLQTWAASNYVVQAPAGPRCRRGRLALAYGISWPSTYGQMGDVTVRFICGWSKAELVPPMLRQAMLVDIAALYANREGEAPIPDMVAAVYRGFHSYARQGVL